jgi:hypothetical protein
MIVKDSKIIFSNEISAKIFEMTEPKKLPVD